MNKPSIDTDIGKNNLLVRPAFDADASRLHEIASEAYGIFVERMSYKPAPMIYDYSLIIAEGNTFVAQCLDDNTVYAMITLQMSGTEMTLRNLAVANAWQKRGVGTLLVSFAIRSAKDRNLASIRLWTHEAMIENPAYYARFGFIESHRELIGGRPNIIMQLRLTE